MAVEFDESEFLCLVDYFVREVKREALLALRNTAILLKSLLQTYLVTNINGLIDRQLEQTLINLKFANPVTQATDDATRYINEIRTLMPPDNISECVGANLILETVNIAMGFVLSFKSFSDSYFNRYRIISFAESLREDLFNDALSYLDILVTIIDDALTKKTEEGLG